MVSHYFRDNPQRRPLAEVMHDILVNTDEAYFVVSFSCEGEPIVEESLFGVPKAKIVRALADGQFDHNGPVRREDRLLDVDTPYAVWRVRPRQCRFDIVTKEIAEAVAKYIVATDHFIDEWRQCPFLDQVWPNWRSEQGVVAA